MENSLLIEKALEYGAYKANVVNVADIDFEPEFRKMCESNACGNYKRNYMCPPYVGEIDDLINKAKKYTYAFVYQTVGQLEDSYDFEGMMAAGAKMNTISRKLKSKVAQCLGNNTLCLGAGGCRLCEKCAKITEEPCRYPSEAMASLETYGINVSKLAELAEMKYINGQNTVTYFGALLFGDNE